MACFDYNKNCKKLEKELNAVIKEARAFIKLAQETKKALKADGLRFDKKCRIKNFWPTTEQNSILGNQTKKLTDLEIQIEAEYKKITGAIPDPGWF